MSDRPEDADGDDEGSQVDDEERTPADDGTGDADRDREAPLSGLADRVRRSRSDRESRAESEADVFADIEGRTGPDEEAGVAPEVGEGEGEEESPFEAMEVDSIHEEAVWESLESEEPEVTDQPEVGSGGEAERVESEDEHGGPPEHVVQKTAYCQRCRFFSDPPDVRCTHEGTSIVEVVDSERFRVRGCPMVERGGTGAGDRRH
ncbi:MAG: hypothetical protein ABEH47_01935 [Haloferacaceae archaeon]